MLKRTNCKIIRPPDWLHNRSSHVELQQQQWRHASCVKRSLCLMWQICGAVNQWSVSHVTKGGREGERGGGTGWVPLQSARRSAITFVLEGRTRRAAVRNHSRRRRRKLRLPIDPGGRWSGGRGVEEAVRWKGEGGAGRPAYIVMALPDDAGDLRCVSSP